MWRILSWFKENKDILFSGSGVALLAAIGRWISRDKKKEPNTKTKKIESDYNSNVQAGVGNTQNNSNDMTITNSAVMDQPIFIQGSINHFYFSGEKDTRELDTNQDNIRERDGYENKSEIVNNPVPDSSINGECNDTEILKPFSNLFSIIKKKHRVIPICVSLLVLVLLLIAIITSGIKDENEVSEIHPEENLDLLDTFEVTDEQKNSYELGVHFYQNAYYEEAIDEFEECRKYLDSEDYIAKCSMELYSSAKESFDKENYKQAKERLVAIPKDTSIYKEAQLMLVDINNKEHEKELQENYLRAVEEYEAEEYEDAQKLFMQLGEYEDSKTYLEQIGEFYFRQSQDAYLNMDYETCREMLEMIDTQEEWPRYLETLDYRQKIIDEQYDTILLEGRDICRREGEAAMKAYVESKESILIDPLMVAKLKTDCLVKTKSLGDIKPYFKASKQHIREVRGFEDLTGNIYDFALVSFEPDYGYDTEWVYELKGEYSTFVADIVVGSEPSKNSIGSVRIYGDGINLFTAEAIEPKTKSYPIEVDVTGIQDLSITINGNIYLGYYGLGNPRLIQ